jgi:CRISPR/Cas system-associated exonuclease Cas4 (RecB family)
LSIAQEIIGTLVSEACDHAVAQIRDTNDRDQSYFHPSTVGYCPRKTTLERLGVAKPPYPIKLQRVFENGHGVHARLQAELKAAGVLVLDEVPVQAPDHCMHGHTDGIGTVYVAGVGGVSFIIEIKSCSSKSWKWMVGEGFYKGHGPDLKHIKQVQLYMYMSGLPYAVIIYENKDTQERQYFTIKRDTALIEELLTVVDLVNAAVLDRRLPPRDAAHQPVKGKSGFECLYCDYRKVCEKEERLREASPQAFIDLIALGTEELTSQQAP